MLCVIIMGPIYIFHGFRGTTRENNIFILGKLFSKKYTR